MKERVVFEANVPVTATLAYSDGLKVQGRFGDQIMYSLADGRVMYVPPTVRDRVLELGIQRNEPFAICKTERREANRRIIDWVVKRKVSTQALDDAKDYAVVPQQSSNHSTVAAGSTSGDGKCNGNGRSAGSGRAAIALRAALMSSIEAALAAEGYASTRGLSVRFGSEDLRAMALTLFIQHTRDGDLR